MIIAVDWDIKPQTKQIRNMNILGKKEEFALHVRAVSQILVYMILDFDSRVGHIDNLNISLESTHQRRQPVLKMNSLSQRCRINLRYFYDENQLTDEWMDGRTDRAEKKYPFFSLKSVDVAILKGNFFLMTAKYYIET